jgi:hypothetical protein
MYRPALYLFTTLFLSTSLPLTPLNDMHVQPTSLPLYLSTSNKRYACTAYLSTALPLYLSNSPEGYACTTYLFTSLPLYLSTSLPLCLSTFNKGYACTALEQDV